MLARKHVGCLGRPVLLSYNVTFTRLALPSIRSWSSGKPCWKHALRKDTNRRSQAKVEGEVLKVMAERASIRCGTLTIPASLRPVRHSASGKNEMYADTA